MGDEATPWARERGESSQAYRAFLAYRDRGPCRQLTPCRSIERRWSARWRWGERARAWDDERQRRADAALLDAIRAGSRSA